MKLITRTRILKSLLCLLSLPITQSSPLLQAYEGTEGTAPKTPNQSLATLHTKPGLRINLVAAEPLISSPVAIDWDAAGNLWVCEMFDYPSGLDENWKPGGRITKLRDTDHDGTYDESVLFLDGLPFPTGLTAWGRGLLICAAPDILYAEDTDNDGKADKVEKLFSGFVTENYQARVNSLSLGLDNWIYGANGLLGGRINHASGEIDIRGHDFRFPSRFPIPHGPLETVAGLTQQGRVRDDWGRWFGCNNGNALLYYPNELRYFHRNPHVPAPPSTVTPQSDFDSGRIYPASRVLERFNDPSAANRITSGCGLAVYRDTLLGEEYYNNSFTCEPVHNLVHRLILEEQDLELRRVRAPDEQQSEFLVSTDNWFRPVQVRTGPDGALYIVDMYRFLIEHPRWVPAARLASINVRAGASMGRIYRVQPANKPLRPVHNLRQLALPALIAGLDSPNGTERDRAHLEILFRNDTDAIRPLTSLASTARLPQVRVQALSILDGLNALDMVSLIGALNDSHDRVRTEAIRLCEPFLAVNRPSPRDERERKVLISTLLARQHDTSLLVARQLSLTLGEWDDPRAGRALAEVATTWLDQADIRAAILSSANKHCAQILQTVMNLDRNSAGADSWLEPLIATAAASHDVPLFNQAFLALLPRHETIGAPTPSPSQLSALSTLLTSLENRDVNLQDYVAAHPELLQAQTRLNELLAAASMLATNSAAPAESRQAAIQLIGSRTASNEELALLCTFLTDEPSEPLRTAAATALRRQRSQQIPDRLLQSWSRTTPTARGEIVNLLLTRQQWTHPLLTAIEQKVVQPREISLADRQRLATSQDKSIRQRAAKILPAQPPTQRAEVIKRYQPSLSLQGNPLNGSQLFTKHCAACHLLEGLGHAVGPDLAALRSRDSEYWLKNIFDPNAVVEPSYVAYEVETSDDRLISGVIKTETASSITLVAGSGATEIVPRSEILEIRAANLSLMPEGLEEAINTEQMADLLAFLRPVRTAKQIAGNEPVTLQPDDDHIILLPATNAAIYGDDITLESTFNNIGMWHGKEDQVAWTFQATRASPYEVHIDYACAENSANNPFRITCGNQSITGRVHATGAGWSRYLQRKIGTIKLEAGQHRLTLRPGSTLRGALIDLRSIALTPPGRSPKWPAPAKRRDTLLRDPRSIGRFLIDPAEPSNAREAVIRANPQFAAAIIRGMTSDLVPGTPAEYQRIPWIWRVAIACGKRNDPGQIIQVLEVSLPEKDRPLHDWQSVVIGGGIINGLSLRGLWPAERLAEIIGDNRSLRERWQRSLNLAAAMADNPQVPGGTRYDALRMIGMEPWTKRGAQLVGYLGKDANAELQMGAVSGLADLPSPQATAALVAALEHLTPGNRALALDALLRDDERTEALLDRAADLGWDAKTMGPERVTKLLDHPNPAFRKRARELLGD